MDKDGRYWNEEGIISYKSGDLMKAGRCWEYAALLGDPNAMFELGILRLREGLNNDNLQTAAEWFRKASLYGHRNADKQLNKINTALSSGDMSIISIPDSFSCHAERDPLIEKKIVCFSGIRWLVLHETTEAYMCLSYDILSVRRFHEREEDVNWSGSSLRRWLNSDFPGSINAAERETVLSVRIENPNNPVYGTVGGPSTVDSFFLLSAQEIDNYLGQPTDMNMSDYDLLNTDRSVPEMTAFLDLSESELNDIQKRSGHDLTGINGMALGWWLRTPGIDRAHTMRVNCRGKVRLYGRRSDSDLVGVRPAVWLRKGEYMR